ncbi:MAG: RagB/SusD family nutrient uptake outer membrane protein [Rikenellaceae bacterium]
MRKFYIFILFLIASITTSCDSVFDYDADDRYDYDSIFDDYSKAGKYLNTCYASLHDYNRWGGCGTFIAAITDEAHDAHTAKTISYYNDECSSANELVIPGHYTAIYEGIRHCNVFLSRIDEVERFTIESYKSRWTGEAYMIRAKLMWELIKRYGPMPIVKEVFPLDYDYSQMSKPTFQECVESILEDIELANAEPEFLWRIDGTNESESMTHAVGYAIKSQAKLFAASPLWNEDNDPALWEDALKYTKLAIDSLESHGFAMYIPSSPTVTGASAYEDTFFASMTADAGFANKEAIYQTKARMTLWALYGVPLLKASGVTSSGISPVQELVDSYETIDGVPILNLERPYLDENHTVPNYNAEALISNGGMYDPANPYDNRDPRLRSSIICNGDYQNPVAKTNQVFTYAGGNCATSSSDALYTSSGYYLRKFINWNSSSSSAADAFWCHYRMAEMYLNYAEAEFHVNGVTANALEAVNKVRSRSGMPDLPTNLTADQFELRLRNERRVELAFEEHRYYDLRRWKLNEQYEGLVTRMDITKNGDGSYSYTRAVLSERAVTETRYNKYRLWPVPLAEENLLRLHGVEIQNPGW